MSYFVYGGVPTRGSGPSIELVAARLRTAGRSSGIHVSIGGEIQQRSVREALSAVGLSRPEIVTYMLTSSAALDTADDLVSPYYSAVSYPHRLEESVKRIASWVTAVFEESWIDRLDMVISEGFDTTFRENSSSPEGFASVALDQLLGEMSDHSLLIRVFRSPTRDSEASA